MLRQGIEHFQPLLIQGIGNILDIGYPKMQGHPNPFGEHGHPVLHPRVLANHRFLFNKNQCRSFMINGEVIGSTGSGQGMLQGQLENPAIKSGTCRQIGNCQMNRELSRLGSQGLLAKKDRGIATKDPEIVGVNHDPNHNQKNTGNDLEHADKFFEAIEKNNKSMHGQR